MLHSTAETTGSLDVCRLEIRRLLDDRVGMRFGAHQQQRYQLLCAVERTLLAGVRPAATASRTMARQNAAWN